MPQAPGILLISFTPSASASYQKGWESATKSSIVGTRDFAIDRSNLNGYSALR